MATMQRLHAIAAWTGTVIAVWLAYSLGRGSHSWAGTVLALLCAVLAAPPVQRIIRPAAVAWIGAAALGIAAFWIGANDAAEYASREQTAAEHAAIDKARQAREDRQADFAQRKGEILREIAAKADAGQHTAAMAQAMSYSTNDPDLANLRRTIEAAMLKQEAKTFMHPERRVVVFARLSELEPSDAGFREQAQGAAADAAHLRASLDRINRGYCPDAGYDYDATLAAFMRDRGTDPTIARRLDSEGPFIGLQEPLFLAYFCPFVASVNETQTAAGTSRQYVMKGHIAGRYVYTRAGAVAAVQR